MGKGKGAEPRPRELMVALAAVCVLTWLAVVWASACGGAGGQSPVATAPPTASRTVIPRPTASPIPTRAATPGPPAKTPTPVPDPPATPEEQPPSVGLLTVVDKQKGLPAQFVPLDLVAVANSMAAPGLGGQRLRAEAAEALSALLAEAAAAGHDIRVRSSYRSYAEQESTFAYWVSVLGEEEARRVSAEAGHSEHQLGTTVDLTDAEVGYDLTEAFGETPSGRWLRENAHRQGFAHSYPADAEAVTGYAYEPWHYRYIGAEHAAAQRASGLTLVEYLRGIEG